MLWGVDRDWNQRTFDYISKNIWKKIYWIFQTSWKFMIFPLLLYFLYFALLVTSSNNPSTIKLSGRWLALGGCHKKTWILCCSGPEKKTPIRNKGMVSGSRSRWTIMKTGDLCPESLKICSASMSPQEPLASRLPIPLCLDIPNPHTSLFGTLLLP